MRVNQEKQRYIDFTKKYFPNTLLLGNEDVLGVLFSRVHENSVVTSILEKHITSQGGSIEFLVYYRKNFNKLLVTYPLNEAQAIYSNIRLITESLLKFLYSINNSLDVETIKKTKFRIMKEELMKTSMNQNALNILFSLYSRYSNYIHDKEDVDSKELDFIENIITTKNNYLTGIVDELITLLNNYYVLICSAFRITQSQFSSSENLRLIHNLSSKRYKKFSDSLYSSGI
ncbi:hypothetical protein PSTEL_05035 [Paenibacillus stellifer]|uniref:Uncharacterized protein n=1 Tax=Paenibacillus stellifer TaxID=169760 RepID=A0A089LTJ3_9BACL|nr:hypothetical protein [Paenibacillus stellifer]AIQ62558.1 hypothetical protein PSTEL_05035 [Paenibacillus stellifer]